MSNLYFMPQVATIKDLRSLVISNNLFLKSRFFSTQLLVITKTKKSEEKTALEEQIEHLTNQLAAQGGIHEIAVNLIDPDPAQPRQTFPQLVIQERAESLRRQGQQNPIVLIPQIDGRYKIFDGELRWRSAPFAGMTKLKAVFLPKEETSDEVVVFEGQLVSSIHSQKLHDLDLATALIRLIIYKYPDVSGREDEIPKFLNAFINRLVRSKKLQYLALIKDFDLMTQQEWLETSKPN